jgi:predicted nucleotidyltransferase/uncharacterized protein (UPF0332 family)
MSKKHEKEVVSENVEGTPQITPEMQDKLTDIKIKLEKLKDELIKKFPDYLQGVALLPPSKEEGSENFNTKKINVLVLIDDQDSKKYGPEERKEKLSQVIEANAKEIDENLFCETITLSELWQSCYDSKSEVVEMIATSAPVYDKGMLGAVKLTALHKEMVLKKFEKYIVCYVLAGSLPRGDAHKDSDIDVFIVIDDTDVKKMTRTELRDKLRAIIIGMGAQAGEMTGIRNKLNLQVYILTDFWDSVKDANPVIFTFLRDGVPIYDRGIFMPWKQLLQMGKIKPSPEAIDMFMSSGDQIIRGIRAKMKNLIESDIYWATLTPSQAAIMLYGLPPPTPKETIEIMKDIFVKKEKLLEKEYVDILQKIRDYYKDIEHGKLENISGNEIEELVAGAEKYLKRLDLLFKQIEERKARENIVHIFDEAHTIVRDALKLEGVDCVTDEKIESTFKHNLIDKGKIPTSAYTTFKAIIKAKKDYDESSLTKLEVSNVGKKSTQFVKQVIDYIQRKRGNELGRAKIRVKYADNKFGEIIIFNNHAFIIHNLDDDAEGISKCEVTKNGKLERTEKSNMEEFEKYLATAKIPEKMFIKETLFEDLKNIFGKDVEILVNY